MSKPKKYKIIYFTNCENGFYNLKNIVDYYFIEAVVTFNRKDAVSQISGFIDVTSFCKRKKIKIISLKKYDDLSLDLLKDLDFNLIIVNGWSRLIPKDLINACKHGAIGIHAGHPPIGHGRAPIPWNIIYGFKDLEVYSFFLTKNADDGDILKKKTIEISNYDTAKLVYEKLTYVSDIIIKETINELEFLEPQKQNPDNSVFYKKRSPYQSQINFNNKAEDIYNFVRALDDPYPNAFMFLDNKKYYVKDCYPFDKFIFREEIRNPGLIIETFPSGIIVMTQDYPLILKNVYDGSTKINFEWNMKSLIGKKIS